MAHVFTPEGGRLRPWWLAAACLSIGALGAAVAAPAAPGGPRDWRDQVIYFALTDRFDDGQPANNDFGHGEFDRRRDTHYQGGDLVGLTRRLDYIRGLGATALWLTPPVANQWLDPTGRHTGYHGYWAEHFMKVDRHLGTLADYQRLSKGLHRRGMALVQDIVLNHTGNYFGYRGGWNAADPAAFHERYAGTPPVAAPSQPPFHLNDPRDPAQRAAGIYHWTPDISDYNDARQEHEFQMSGLDDLNTDHPAVRRALRRSYGHWIRAAGVDAFRIDTAFYVSPAAIDDFLYSTDRRAPGVMRVARDNGRPSFHVFGEGFGIDRPFDDTQARKIEGYMSGPAGQRRMPGMLNFPLYGAFNSVFAQGAPTAELAHRIEALARVHARPHLMPTFVDNHDVDRFLTGGTPAGLAQALLAMFTLPGIPTVYYGTEQGFTVPRASMFAAGHGSGGRDRFDTAAPLYQAIARMAALRREHRLFSRGWPQVLQADAEGPGLIAWRMVDGPRQALVVFNTDEQPAMLKGLPLQVPPGTRLAGLYGLHGRPADVRVGHEGQLGVSVPARGGLVWRIEAPAPDGALLDGARARGVGGSEPPAASRWSAPAPRAWAWQPAVDDPVGDDHGPEGRYTYPTDASYAGRPTMDLRQARVATDGGALRIELTMGELSRQWNPPNGFDHVAFTLFIELPGRAGGATVMPMQHAQLPDGMRWHLRLRSHGWSNALFAAEGASATHEGRPVVPAARIETDAAQRRVSFTLPPAALGRLPSLAGARIFVTTWDYDGGFRPLEAQPAAWSIGGGDPATGARIMDASPVIVVQ